MAEPERLRLFSRKRSARAALVPVLQVLAAGMVPVHGIPMGPVRVVLAENWYCQSKSSHLDVDQPTGAVSAGLAEGSWSSPDF